jgi:hypothetical protein
MKRIHTKTFRKITAPLKKEAKRFRMKESDLNKIIHKARRK